MLTCIFLRGPCSCLHHLVVLFGSLRSCFSLHVVAWSVPHGIYVDVRPPVFDCSFAATIQLTFDIGFLLWHALIPKHCFRLPLGSVLMYHLVSGMLGIVLWSVASRNSCVCVVCDWAVGSGAGGVRWSSPGVGRRHCRDGWRFRRRHHPSGECYQYCCPPRWSCPGRWRPRFPSPSPPAPWLHGQVIKQKR